VGDLSVSEQTGTFTYQYPITVPPGRLGIQPALALSYSSSGARRGGIAAGWSLDVPQTALDFSKGVYASAPWVSSLASGQRLVPIPGTREFRAQDDTSQTHYFQTGPITNPAWEVRTTAGQVLRFNEAPNFNGPPNPDKALLTSTTDAFGNTVAYFWTRWSLTEGFEESWYLTKVQYTANSAAGIVHHAEVPFNWGAAPSCDGITRVGASLDVRRGVKQRNGSFLLMSIVTRVRDTPTSAFRDVRGITLGYDADAMSCSGVAAPTRLLTSIQEFAASRTGVVTTFPATTFSYGSLWQSRSTSLPGFTMPHHPDHYGVSWGTSGTPSQIQEMLLDVDGDGLVDRLASTSGTTCNVNWFRNNGQAFVQANAFSLPRIPWGYPSYNFPNPEYCSLSLQQSNVTTPGLLKHSPSSACRHAPSQQIYRYLDLDGDALPELVTAILYRIYSYDPDSQVPPSSCQPYSDCDPLSPYTTGDCEDQKSLVEHQTSDGKWIVTIHKNRGHGTFDAGLTQYWPVALDAAGGNTLARSPSRALDSTTWMGTASST